MTGKPHLIGLVFLLFSAASPIYSQTCDCVSTGNCPVPIVDNGSFDGTLDVTTLGANDLGTNPLTSVCFSITHTWIGDLNVSLTSPSGVSYLLMADINNNYGGCGQQQDNLEVCIVLGDNHPLTNNTDYQCNAGPCTSGVCCLTGDWTVACNVTDPINNTPVAPNCDLADFNVPGNPVNGTWTLTVTDVCNMDTGVLNNFSLEFAEPVDCIVCEADGGALDTMAITTCQGDPDLELNLPIDFTANPAEYGYTFLIVRQDTVLALDPVPDLSGLPVGTYQVFGFSYLLEDTSSLSTVIGMHIDSLDEELLSTIAPFCADISSNPIPVTILPVVPVTVIDTSVCQGDCIMVGGQSICSSVTLTLSSFHGCDSVVQVTLTQILPDTVYQNVEVCEGGCTTVGGQSYCAPGPYFIHLNTWQGCDSVINLTFNEHVVDAVITPANPPALTCTNTSVMLSAANSSPVGASYSWSGPGGFVSTNASITATTAGTYSLTVTDNTISPACSATTSVTVVDNVVLPDLSVVGPAPQICSGNTFDLSTLTIQDANNTNSSISFHSGTPATPANELGSSIVSPTGTTTYYILGTVGTCTDEISVTVTVLNVPTASFTADANICQSETATITYTGNAPGGAIYNWDFDGGTIVSGNGAGPYEIAWPAGGSYTVSLTVEGSGCISADFSQTINVEEPLQAPVIACATTTSSIDFSWGIVPGANSYTVNLLSGTAGIQSGNTYSVTGLNPGDQVTIEVVANGTGACGNSAAQITCTAENCLPVIIDILPVADICRTATSAPINLTATITGGNGGGTLTWSGNGITNGTTGTFDPNLAVLGSNLITVQYQEGNCNYTETIQINVYQTPTADFTATSIICLNETTQIVYTGVVGPGATYNWDFDGGNAMPGTGQGPHQVAWNTPGTHTVTLMVVSADGCSSQQFSMNVTVEAPLAQPFISCITTTSSITFNWTPVPGANGYNISVQGQQLTVTNTTYLVDGLTPGDTVSIIVEALGSTACGPSINSETCQAQDCPIVTVDIQPVADICRTAGMPMIPLIANLGNNAGNGTFTWSGTGVSADGFFDPNQANIGTNTVNLLYEEGTCSYAASININVFEIPVAAFVLPAAACEGEVVSVSYNGPAQAGLQYDWNFGTGIASPTADPATFNVAWQTAGQHTMTLAVTSSEGCVSTVSSNNISIEAPLQSPTISCNVTTSSIQFSWPNVPGAVSYDVVLLDGPAGVQATNSYTISGIPSGSGETATIQLSISGGGVCPPATVESTCTVLDCPTIAVDVLPVADICLVQNMPPVQLNVVVTGGNNGSALWSGAGITNATTGIFNLNTAGAGLHEVFFSYSEQGCEYSDSIDIQVYQTPTAAFSADNNICVENTATVTFTGTAGPGAVYNWDFGGGVASPGVGPGPHQVSWTTAGSKTITLQVTQGNCNSQVFSQIVLVDEALSSPDISCSATTNSVLFFWSKVVGASSYDVAVLNGPTGVATSDTSFVFSNLDPGEQVAIQVTAIGNTSCPDPVVQMACNAQPCPGVTIDILPVSPICITNAEPVVLLADVNGGSPGAISSWAGPGVANGIFDPAVAGVGVHTIVFDYQFVNCAFSAQTEITVAPPPTADAGEDGTLSCWETETTHRLGGINNSVGPNIIYSWSFDGGPFPGDPNQLHPEVSEPGVYTILVVDPDLGCFSTDDVTVTSTKGNPDFEVKLKPISCQGKNDAEVTITNIGGGLEPYYFSLNGQPFVEETFFPFLTPGDYELTMMDAAGCQASQTFTVEVGQVLTADLSANLMGKDVIYAGEPLQLFTVSSFPAHLLDTIIWTPADILSCADCLNPVATPWSTTVFTVTIQAGECVASDELQVIVDENVPVYVPNAFSPNGDNINDLFTIFSGPQVASVRNFMVFDRWGESVFQAENSVPGEPALGWDGTHRGRLMNPAVFTWFAELELLDGSTKILKGDVTLVR